jgi:transposase-like protein
MGRRKRYTAEQKVGILREILEEGKAVSSVAEEYQVHPNMILAWRKQLFEGAVKTFEVRRPDWTLPRLVDTIKRLALSKTH